MPKFNNCKKEIRWLINSNDQNLVLSIPYYKSLICPGLSNLSKTLLDYNYLQIFSKC